MQFKKILINTFKEILNKIKTIYKNNPLLLFLLIFFTAILLLNNILISTVRDTGEISQLYITFKEIETKKNKYEFQRKLMKRLKKLDYNFRIYTVEKGENYWGIAKTNHINIDTIVGINPYLKNLYAGIDEHLIVCNKTGCLYIIQKTENIYTIAKKYNISVKEIEKANNINIFKKIFSPLRKGDIIFIPDAKPKLMTEPMLKMYKEREALQSPLGGRYTSHFGYRIHPIFKKRKFHYGLDIKVYIGQPVGAANSGVVTAAGWVGGYGKYIKIKHYNGYETSYGHLSKIYVKVGQKVKQGQIIGKGGNTGRSTGPHLDFRVWYKGKPQAPAKYIW